MSIAARSILSRLHTVGLNLLFPPTCLGCECTGALLCAHCAQSVLPVCPPLCARCGRPYATARSTCSLCSSMRSNITLRAAAIYAEPLRDAVHQLKYGGAVALADPLSRYLVAAQSRQLADIVFDAVVPIPLHKERLAERGYNQAEVLARAFCNRAGLSIEPLWLARRRETRSQVGLTARQRRINVSNAFVAHANVHRKRLLLIDDVYTTGSTLVAAAEAALAAGAAAVYGLALAIPAFDPQPAAHASLAVSRPSMVDVQGDLF